LRVPLWVIVMRQMAKPFMQWLLLGSVLLVSMAWAGDGWQTISNDEGILVERHRVPGMPSYEMRASTHSPFSPSVIFDTLWKHQEYVEFVPYLKKLEILKQSAYEKVIYEQIRMPLVSDRDYTVKITVEHYATNGVIQIRFVAVPHEGPSEHPNYVRVKHIQGGWTLEPTADGGSDVTYVVASQPGGTIPAWIINVAQKAATPNLLKAMLQRVGQNAPQ
jgi:ribosome-associated toxin RatA of RatAB toxin-antitoxin module